MKTLQNNETNSKQQGGWRVSVVELLFEFALPIIGGILTGVIVLRMDIPLIGALLLMVLGALAFQWAFVLVVTILAAIWPNQK